ncbi:glycosyltransferase family 2 protein [Nisaea acidiphila]|uniref:Glycosyltransferase family 2 protein n=1 Tax=Nisaea acidiphila TaxID=1862145 RepID=A0A9J7AXY3_9PROT|nr:glycosyltransferase family A protein [Nisaea acidiphila]UUX51297.1 glycosyltransferase family 2 protein [Nisaea acidiphila]
MKKQRPTPAQLTQFGHDLLGPIVNLYFLRLHAHLLQTDPVADRILFLLRAGLRLKSLYEIWLACRDLALQEHVHLLRTSRLMAVKGTYAASPSLALTALGSELEGEPLDRIVRGLLRAEQSRETPLSIPEVPPQPLHDFLQSDAPTAERVRRHLRRQSRLFADYVEAVAGSAERLLLIDTGWRGTQQLLFEQAFDDWHWSGLYFGCIGRASISGEQPAAMTGLMFDTPLFDPDQPASILLQHRHLIESVFEPNVPSIERIDHSDIDRARKGRSETIREKRLADPAFDGVCAYLRKFATASPTEALDRYEGALRSLSRLISEPDTAAIALLARKPRSLDLGRTGAVGALLPACDRFPEDSPEQRVEDSLWPPGQAALEFSGQRRLRVQRRLLEKITLPAAPKTEDRVAIVTRTKDRPLLFRRAAESVSRQSYGNYVWVVVNDGGDPGPVRDILSETAIDPARILFCSFDDSQGMEAASNAGIRNSRSDLIVIHDDDDSWEPDFLARTVGFLGEHEALYDGVVTHSTHVTEEISNGSVIERDRKPFNGWLSTVQLAEMAVANSFPPIAFLYRRALWERLEGYDESLPVLGDWDFNLRFLLEADIGVLDAPLANYHHRTGTTAKDTYANSDLAARNPHIAYNALIRNKYLRGGAADPKLRALASLMGDAYLQEDLRARIESVRPAAMRPGTCEDVAALRSRLTAQRNELHRGRILLHMTVSEIIRSRGLSIGVDEMIRQLSGLADEYAETAGLSASTGRQADWTGSR